MNTSAAPETPQRDDECNGDDGKQNCVASEKAQPSRREDTHDDRCSCTTESGARGSDNPGSSCKPPDIAFDCGHECGILEIDCG